MASLGEWQYLWFRVIAKAWDDPAGFGAQLQAPRPGVRQIISQEFGYKPYQDFPLPFWVDLRVRQAGPKSWLGGIGAWQLPYTELVLELPAPPDPTIHSQGVALADLAQKWVALESIDPPEEPGPRQPGSSRGEGEKNVAKLVDERQFESGLESFGSPMFTSGPESPAVGFDQMIRWYSIWPQTVANAWRYPEFMDFITAQDDARLVLYNAFGYEVPGGVRLKVTRGAKPYVARRGGVYGTPPAVELTMFLPPSLTDEQGKPSADGPIALGAYAGSGRANPFTLCLPGT